MRRGPTKRHTNHNLGNAPCALCHSKMVRMDGRDKRWWKRFMKMTEGQQS